MPFSDINILRRLDRVVLETFQVTSASANQTQLLNPLFFVDTSQGKEQHSIVGLTAHCTHPLTAYYSERHAGVLDEWRARP